MLVSQLQYYPLLHNTIVKVVFPPNFDKKEKHHIIKFLGINYDDIDYHGFIYDGLGNKNFEKRCKSMILMNQRAIDAPLKSQILSNGVVVYRQQLNIVKH